jgi:hypothetical protein
MADIDSPVICDPNNTEARSGSTDMGKKHLFLIVPDPPLHPFIPFPPNHPSTA